MTMTQMIAPRPFCSTPASAPKSPEAQALHESIQEALSHAGHQEFRSLAFDCDGEAITISGRVPTYYLKQLVQSIALAAPGVRQVNKGH
jgi:osmotically-inducible protein OsmY